MSQPLTLDRPPRIQPELPFEQREIPNPPETRSNPLTQLLQVSVPLVSIIGYIMVSILGGGKNPGLLIPMAISVIASTVLAVVVFRQDQVQRKADEKAYRDRLNELYQEMQESQNLQRRFYQYNYPESPTALRLASDSLDLMKNAGALQAFRTELRVGERRVWDDDFGVVRLGMGTLPSTVTYTLSELSPTQSGVMAREAQKLATDSLFVSDIPVIVNLRQPRERDDDEKVETVAEQERVVPFAPALAIAGERGGVYEFTRSLLAHFSVFHAPNDSRLYILASRKDEWRWTRNLPHCQSSDDQPLVYFAEDANPQQEAIALDDDEPTGLQRYLEGIRKLLAQRKIKMQERTDEKEATTDPTLPFCLMVVDMLDAADNERDLLHEIHTDAAISILLEEGATLGAAIIFLVPRRNKVPGGCRAVIEIGRTVPTTNSRGGQHEILHFRYAEVGVNTTRYVGQADGIAEPHRMELLAQQLGSLEIRQSGGANLVPVVPFLQMMGQPSLADLEKYVDYSWSRTTEAAQAKWMRAKLGFMAGNKPRTLAFEAKRDGNHGMVAGSTGSGKSELLISLITSMAVRYDPTVVNFVLVDYKGGGAFEEFRQLPHCVDIVTNLNGDGVTRMFTAIRAEMERRQKLNADTDTKDIVAYRKKGLHLSREPYPFLFIIIDEFAEMIADRAEFKTQLESITRVGRAQGVSLILAAQRPSGVTDQMRSNIKFRICLRVETPGESRELLRRTDAAFLPTTIPGRGYIQVGNEEIELIQSAYSGEPYVDPALHKERKVNWLNHPNPKYAGERKDAKELFRVVVERLNQKAVERKTKRQLAPWPGFLPRNLSLTDPLTSKDPQKKTVTDDHYLIHKDDMTLGVPLDDDVLTLNPALNRWQHDNVVGWIENLDWKSQVMRPVIGLVDNPHAAKQFPLVVDLPRGHAAVFGGSGWGKTIFLRTMLTSLAATHSPSYLHMYIVDFGGRNLYSLKSMPHVGAMITPDEAGYEEQIEQLIRELNNVIEVRKNILVAAGAESIEDYNVAHPGQELQAILLAVDNFTEFVTTFNKQQDNVESLLDRFINLVRQSRPYGINCVITATSFAGVPNSMMSIFTERFALRLNDSNEYREILGGAVGDVSDVPGRGFAMFDQRLLTFHTARVQDSHSNQEGMTEAGEIEELAQRMTKQVTDHPGQYRLPFFKVDALRTSITTNSLLARDHNLSQDQNFYDGLRALAAAQWRASTDPANADWLRAVIGIGAGNATRTLSLEAKRDGVHALVAGGTGSGKSELLMTLIVGLALRYDPMMLNFVLVDYKGGGAFTPFKSMPHVVDIVTNLNKSAVKRMFTAIRAEMERRQELNTDTKTKDIVDYHKQSFHLKREPYPFLFIIVDEYAEMISDNPEFKEELDSITRLGRAQGVHLLLASQRPVGVSDQMRANIKLRICLKVEQVDTSREMLRRSDAAFLPNGMPGRGYIQVGNENIELIQVAWSGETITNVPPNETGESPKFFEVAVRLSRELLAANNGANPATPWPPALQPGMTFDDPLQERYIRAKDRAFMSQGFAGNTLCLNPFVAQWANGAGGWPGVDWSKNGDALQAIVGVLDDPRGARQIPLIVNFNTGNAVLLGGSGWGKTTFLRSMIVSMAARHRPSDLNVHILELGTRFLNILSDLPHVGTIILPDEDGYKEKVKQLWTELNEVIDRRKRLFSDGSFTSLPEYNYAHPEAKEAAILVVIDNIAEYIDTFGEQSKSASQSADDLMTMWTDLVRQGRSYGIHFIVTATRYNVLSNKLYSLFSERLTLRLTNADEYAAVVGSGLSEIEEIQGRGATRVGKVPLLFQTAVMPRALDVTGQPLSENKTIAAIGAAMREMMRLNRDTSAPFKIEALPKSVMYRNLLAREFGFSPEEVGFMGGLDTVVRTLWDERRVPANSAWLTAPLGTISGNKTRWLNFEAQADGVHAMIAGGTGSGKSELLMTMIVGLALNNPPDILNFVLVDYKGGGAFKPFENMPHVVATVTNLNKSGVSRMFTAINAEIRRRQKLNVDTNTKDIVDYRKQGYHLMEDERGHKKYGAYPHLFIIIDEYAEMIDDNPEYKAQLESITRVGRAQGINLVLASQRPKGVTDQMRANIKLRMCLRVEQIETSQEMLRSPDAAFLPNKQPGRGYVQVGNNNIELIQVAWCGEKIAADGADAPKKEMFAAAVEMTAAIQAGEFVPHPWPDTLPAALSLESPQIDSKTNRAFVLNGVVGKWARGAAIPEWPTIDWTKPQLTPVVGLLDDPAEARQLPHRFDLGRNHLVIFGDAGSGKSVLLRTIATNLATAYSPRDLHMYVLDLGGRALRTLEGFPHVGAVVYADEETYEERLQRLLDFLANTVESRQRQLSEVGVDNLAAYNAKFPDKALPAMVVFIDNFAELQENNEMLVEAVILPLVRRSLSAGITFVATANIPRNMPSKLYGLFTERMTFRQSNLDLYMDIVGRGAMDVDDVPGRGYIRSGARPLQFQAALPTGIPDKDGQLQRTDTDDAAGLQERMHTRVELWGAWTAKPTEINILKPHVGLEEILREAPLAADGTAQVVIGRGGDLLPLSLDLWNQGPHCAIVGPPLSGRTTTLRSWIFALAERYPPSRARFVLVDMQRKLFQYNGGKRNLSELPHTLWAIDEDDDLKKLVDRLDAEGVALQKAAATMDEKPVSELFVFIDNFDELDNATSQKFVPIIRRYGSAGLHFIVAAGMDSTNPDMRRQVFSSNFGIGLRNSQSVEALRVFRLPASVRNRELAVGRGFVIKSGQPTMVQIATPDQLLGNEGNSPKEVAVRLDGWVSRIAARYAGQPRAEWASGQTMPVDEDSAAPKIPLLTKTQIRMRDLLQAGIRHEFAGLNGTGEGLVTRHYLTIAPIPTLDETDMLSLLRELWRKDQAARYTQSYVDMMEPLLSVDDILNALADSFKDELAVVQNGHAPI